MTCELCERDGGEALWRDERCRVVYVDYPHFPNPIWGARLREPGAQDRRQPVADIKKALAQRLA